MANATKNIPLSALRFAADLELGSNGEGARTVPVKLSARSTQPVDHWYFGRIVHDLAGMSVNKGRVPIDYCHNESEVMGYANKFDTSNGLVCSGALTPFDEKDRASEVIFKSKAGENGQGVPYEASIFFDPASLVLEYVPQGMAVAVNGFQFAGPGVVARQWELRGLAVCPYGQDKDTSVQFAAGKVPEVAVKYTETQPATAEVASTATVEAEADKDKKGGEASAVEPSVPAEEGAQTAETTANEGQSNAGASTAEGTAQPAAAPVEAVVLSVTEDDLNGQKFLTTFGDQGGVWFAQGKKFAECQALFSKQQKDDVDRLTRENEQLRTQLAASRGEREPVSFGGDTEVAVTGNEPSAKQKAALGSGLAKFAANVKFVATKPKKK